MTLLLTGSDVADLLTLDDCIAAVEEAFRAHGEGRLHPPGILSAHEERGAFHIKTAAVNGRFGAKANANFPGQVPSIQGVMLLFDANDGRALAIMDSIELTVLRTGAATAVAANHLARRCVRGARRDRRRQEARPHPRRRGVHLRLDRHRVSGYGRGFDRLRPRGQQRTRTGGESCAMKRSISSATSWPSIP